MWIKRLVAKKYSILIILVALYIISRLVLLLFAADKFLTIDFTKGYVAREIVTGNKLGLFQYQIHDKYQFGFHLVPILIIPFFLIFGQTYFAIKMVPLLFSTSTLILWFLFLDNVCSRKIAILNSLLFILCPFRFTVSFLKAQGFHTDLCFFTILNIYLFYILVVKKRILQRNTIFLFIFIFGVLNGFASSYGYIYFITLCCILLFWNSSERYFFLTKRFLFFVFGFIVGLLPWVIFNLASGFPKILIGGFLSKPADLNMIITLKYILTKIRFVIFEQMTYLFWNENLPLAIRKISSVFYYILVYVSFTSLCYWRRKELGRFITGVCTLGRRKYGLGDKELAGLFIIVYPVLFTIIYFLTPFYKIRYLDVLMPFSFAGVSLFILGDTRRAWLLNIKYFAIVVILSLGLVGNFKGISWRNYGDAFRYRGYEYGEYGRTLADRYMRGMLGLRDVASILNRLNILDRHAAYMDFAHQLVYYSMESGTDLYKFNSIVSHIDPRYRHYFYYHLGERNCEDYFSDDLNEGLKVLSGMDKVFAHYFVKNFANTTGHMFNREDRGNIKVSINKVLGCVQLAESLNDGYKEYFSFGFGFLAGRLYADGLYSSKNIEDLLKKVEFERKDIFYKGLGYGLCSEYIKSPGYIMGSERGEYPMDLQLFKSLVALIDKISESDMKCDYKGKFYEGVMLFWGEYWIKGLEDNYSGNIDIDSFIRYFSSRDSSLIHFIYKGCGEGMANFTTNYYESFEFNRLRRMMNFSEKIPLEYLTYYYEGLGEGYSTRYGFDKEAYEYIICQIKSKKEKESFIFGLQKGEAFLTN